MNTNIVSGPGLLGERGFEAMGQLHIHMPDVNPEVVQNTIRYRNGMIATWFRTDVNRNQALKAK